MLHVSVFLASLLAALAVSTSAAGTDEQIVVTRDSGSLPSGCTPRETAELLVRFTEAVNAGDTEALDRLFTIEDPPGRAVERPLPFFRWYSVTEGRVGDRPWRHTVFYDRADVFPYFTARHRQSERWELIAVDVGPAGWIPGAAGITYWIRRDAGDLPPSLTRLAIGKGDIDCAAQRIFVWSMGQDDQNRVGTPCPLPPGWTPGSAIVACSRSEEPAERTGSNARAFVPDFRLIAGATNLPRRCGQAFVATRLRSALSAFNRGDGISFARHLALRGSFRPYTLTERPLIGQANIAKFTTLRYARGDGWTGTALRAPRRSTIQVFSGTRRQVAAYRLSLLLSSPGKPLAGSSASIVFDCRSGLIHSWVGPHASAPG
jgi:hypothetical protein